MVNPLGYYMEYRRKFTKTKLDSYLGAVTCPRCGKHGYMRRCKVVNIKTNTLYGKSLIVMHQHSEKGKSVHDGLCYVGYVRVN